MITTKIKKNLEYDKILEILSKHLILPSSKKTILSLEPEDSFEKANSSLNFTKEAEKILFHYLRNPLENFEDLGDILIRAKKHAILDIIDIRKVAHLLRAARIFSDNILSIEDESLCQMNDLAKRLYADKQFEEEIDKTFISDEEITDTASSTLHAIRTKIRRKNNEINESLNKIIRNSSYQKALQDNIITMRGGRFVIPVKVECKGQIQGLIHDYSSSGATIYVEPISVVEANNALRILYSNEQAEIQHILENFTNRVATIADAINFNSELLVIADIILAKAKYAKTINATLPELSCDGTFKIISGRHPLLQVEHIIPVSIHIDKLTDFIVVSGPNTGGKTVTLKMVGLFSLMAMSGMYIPAKDGSKLSFYKNIFSDIGDEQSIEQNLSTFSSHIVTLKYITENVTDNSLVLLDEVGGGTDPEEGSALALAVIEKLLSVGSKGIITTHYTELKEFALVTDRVENASMEFDMDTLSPTYKLNIGVAGLSKAFAISRKLGLNEDLIKNAESKLKDEKVSFDEILESAEQERVEAEKIRLEYERKFIELQEELKTIKAEKEKLFAEKEKITKVAKVEAKRIVSNASDEANELVSKIKNIYNNDIGGADVINASKLKNKLSKINEKREDDINEIEFLKINFDTLKEGDKVYVKSLNSICNIISINRKRKKVMVQLGNMKLEAKESNLKGVSEKYLKYYFESQKPKSPITKKKKVNTSSNVKINNDVTYEKKVLGKRVHEAIAEVNTFIDTSILNGANTVKIIHGVGTGALRKAIQEELKRNKSVKSYRRGEYGEGDIGVTIVELKK